MAKKATNKIDPYTVLYIFLALLTVGFFFVMADIRASYMGDKKTFEFWAGEGGGMIEMLSKIALALAGGLALNIASKRAKAANKQAETAIEQAETAIEQTTIAERSQNASQFQNAADMLGNEKMSVREAGIFSLFSLADLNPKEYYIPTQTLLCAFIRERSVETMMEVLQVALEKNKEFNRAKFIERTTDPELDIEFFNCPSDISEAFHAFSALRSPKNMKREQEALWTPDLHGTYFIGHHTKTRKDNFRNAFLFGSRFDRARFMEPDFKGALLGSSNIDEAQIYSTTNDPKRWPTGYKLVRGTESFSKFVKIPENE